MRTWPGADDCHVLVESHLSKRNTNAKNARCIPGVRVDNSAGQLAAARAIGDANAEFRHNGDRFDRFDIATARAQLGRLSENQRTIVQRNFSLRAESEPRRDTPFREGNNILD